MRKFFSVLFILAVTLLIFPASAFAALTWSETQPAGNINGEWTPSDISPDGQFMIVGTQSAGRLYLSTNGGSSWSETRPAGDQGLGWYTASISSDGETILAGVYEGRLYLTTDGGDNWTETRPAADADYKWFTTSMSSDGQTMLAAINSEVDNGRLYLSTNGGDSWTEIQPQGDQDLSWATSSISEDGHKLIAGVSNGRIYLSTDGGSWTETRPAGDMDYAWTSTSMSADGETILAAGSNARVFLSTNSGDSWTETQPAGDEDKLWYVVATSSDGQTMFAINGEKAFISSSGGSSWSETQPIDNADYNWVLGAMSGDSTKMLAGIYDGRLYLGSNPLPASSSNNSVYHPPAGFGPPSCNDTAPSAIPDLFRVDAAGTYVNLYFSTVSGGTGYNVNYGPDSNANQYGDLFGYSGDLWNIGRTISGLSPNTTYYFKVQSVNGCNAGEWSSVKSVKTKGRTANVSQWFANLNPFSSNPSLITSKSSGQAVAGVSKTPGSCSYTVQEGDSFWRIAEKELGRGSRFGELVGLNPGVSVLQIGQTISVCK